MKITFMMVGKTGTAYIREAVDDYIQRASRYMTIESIQIPDVKTSKKSTAEVQKEAEGREILARLKSDDKLILLDERGKDLTSRQLAELIEKSANSGLRNLVFLIGGPYGFSKDVYSRANGQICLSRMTFPHELIRLFFAEQLYRAQTILRNEPYHHD